MTEPSMKRKTVAQACGWVLAALPYATVLIFIAYGLSVRSVLGYWPVIYQDAIPDSLELLDSTASVLLFTTMCSVPVGIVASILTYFDTVRAMIGRQILVYWIGFFTGAWLARWDPTGFLGWFID
jgi:hypothetical protein